MVKGRTKAALRRGAVFMQFDRRATGSIIVEFWPAVALIVFWACYPLVQWFAYSSFGGDRVMMVNHLSDACEAFVYCSGFVDSSSEYLVHATGSPGKLYRMSSPHGEWDFSDRLRFSADGQFVVTETYMPRGLHARAGACEEKAVWMYTHGLDVTSGEYLKPGIDWSMNPASRQSLHDRLAALLAAHGGSYTHHNPTRQHDNKWRELGYWESRSWQRRIARGSGKQ